MEKLRDNLKKVEENISFSLIAMLLILLTPVYVYAGELFITDYSEMNVGFINFLRIISLLFVIVMMVRKVVKVNNLYDIPEKIDSVIDLAFNGTIIVTVLISFIVMFTKEFTELTVVYYILAALAAYNIATQLTNFKLDLKLDLYTKFFALVILFTALSSLKITMFGRYLLFSYLNYIGEDTLITIVVLITVIAAAGVMITSFIKEVDEKIKIGVVFANIVCLIIVWFRISSVINSTGVNNVSYPGFNLSFSVGLSLLGYLYLVISIGMALYAGLALKEQLDKK